MFASNNSPNNSGTEASQLEVPKLQECDGFSQRELPTFLKRDKCCVFAHVPNGQDFVLQMQHFDSLDVFGHNAANFRVQEEIQYLS